MDAAKHAKRPRLLRGHYRGGDALVQGLLRDFYIYAKRFYGQMMSGVCAGDFELYRFSDRHDDVLWTKTRGHK